MEIPFTFPLGKSGDIRIGKEMSIFIRCAQLPPEDDAVWVLPCPLAAASRRKEWHGVDTESHWVIEIP